MRIRGALAVSLLALGCGGRNLNVESDAGSALGDAGLLDSGASDAISTLASVTAGDDETCVTYGDGTIRCWGAGGGAAGAGSPQPLRVANVVDASQLAIGRSAACVRHSSGAAECWGDDSLGAIGDGQSAPGRFVSSPASVLMLSDSKDIGLGAHTACAVRSAGGVSCWGSNETQMLGTAAMQGTTSDVPKDVVGISDAVSLAVGAFHVCALRRNGSVSCWGDDQSGELGDGMSGAGRMRPTPLDVAGVVGATQLSLGGGFSCAVTNTGTVSCWGDNTFGSLGRGSQGDVGALPALVQNANDVVQVAAGELGFACALTRSGNVICWGANDEGELGNGDTANSPTLVMVSPLPAARQITAGRAHACALARDQDAVWCWGSNIDGQIGTGTTGGLYANPHLVSLPSPQSP